MKLLRQWIHTIPTLYDFSIQFDFSLHTFFQAKEQLRSLCFLQLLVEQDTDFYTLFLSFDFICFSFERKKPRFLKVYFSSRAKLYLKSELLKMRKQP